MQVIITPISLMHTNKKEAVVTLLSSGRGTFRWKSDAFACSGQHYVPSAFMSLNDAAQELGLEIVGGFGDRVR